ncbi:MAG TPA: response regulator transcription factor [Gemmatimonadaceae bacterium]
MSLSQTIPVVVIDDNRLVRDGLAEMLNKLPGVTATAVESVDRLAIAPPPRVVLLDVGVGGEESVRVATSVATRWPETKIIAMDLIPVIEEVMELVDAGVSGFVMKDATFDEFVATIHAVSAGEKVLPPRMTESLFAQIAKEARDRKLQDVLDDVRMTPRELQVIALIGEGLSNKEIAQRLNIAAHTVKSHVRNVMEKLALHTRLQIAAYSRR